MDLRQVYPLPIELLVCKPLGGQRKGVTGIEFSNSVKVHMRKV